MKTCFATVSAAALVAGLTLQAIPAVAQEAAQSTLPVQNTESDCVQPRDTPDGVSGTGEPEGQSDTVELGECDGVIAPAPNVDPSIVIRAPDPDVGEMPVIPPEAVPQTGPQTGPGE